MPGAANKKKQKKAFKDSQTFVKGNMKNAKPRPQTRTKT